MEPKGALLCTQEPPTWPCPEPDIPNLPSHPIYVKIDFNIILPNASKVPVIPELYFADSEEYVADTCDKF
jgi:hypothetical protein